jgi:molybdopterin/thiamine biosynthesis adenylyltransferase
MDFNVIVPHRLLGTIQSTAFDGQQEAGAWTLFKVAHVDCDPVTGRATRRYILNKVVALTQTDFVSSSERHLTIKTGSFVKVLGQAQRGEMTPGFLHGHPSGYAAFSNLDDQNEAALSHAHRNKSGPESVFVSLLALPSGRLLARVWTDPDTCYPATVTITGHRLHKCLVNEDIPEMQALDRQTRVFGPGFNSQLNSLKVLIVGAGGTGSPLSVMLARSGVRSPVILDPDVIEETNLHRLYGATVKDIGSPKATVLAAHLNGFGLGTNALGIQGNLLDVVHRDLLKSADVIFCCTDDHASRLFLNRFAYFYEIPVIDIGLAIERGEVDVKDMTGRVTRLGPGSPCLLCRNIVDPRRAREEELRAKDPEAYARQVKEGYILGGGDPEPAFISMTTSVATLAMEELLQLMTGFRGDGCVVTQRLRRFQVPEDRRTGAKTDPDCPICSETDCWGLGDVTPFLDRVS